MSDAPAGGPEPDGEATPEVEQSSPEGSQPSVSTEAPSRQYLEVDDPDNRWDRVKVDNEEIEVPYSELKRGYSREADYTRKSQALAAERKQVELGLNIQRALEENPQATLSFLAQQYGMNVGQPQAQAPDAPPEFDDPLEAQLYQERQERLHLQQRFEEREADAQLQQAVTGLRQQFNLNDDDIRSVISTAHRNNLGINALPMVAKQMMFDRIAARLQAQQQMTSQQQAEEAKRQAAAASATAVVGSGTSNGNGLTPQVPVTSNLSLREVIEAAVEQHSG